MLPPKDIGCYAVIWISCFLFNTVGVYTVNPIGKILKSRGTSHDDSLHGSVQMGVLDDDCDNGKDRLDVDLAEMSEIMRTCTYRLPVHLCRRKQKNRPSKVYGSCGTPKMICTTHANRPLHECMNEVIVYNDPIPTSGAHRPIWPVYGEYYYIPPQRWLHSLEHGAAVFLYHPCADLHQLDTFKTLAKTCLRRHIITPYNLTDEQPFAILTWTCRLMLDRVDTNIPAAVEFIRNTALNTYESKVYQDGKYNFLLKRTAQTVTDRHDSEVCPSYTPERDSR